MMCNNKPKIKLTRLRNSLHDHPLLRKCSVHQRSNKSKRRSEKVKIKKEWLPQNIFEVVYFGEAIQRVRVYYAL